MAMQVVIGWGLGYQAAQLQKKGAELKQGTGDLQAAGAQVLEVATLSSVASRVLADTPLAPINAALPFAGLILLPASAAIKKGYFEPGMQKLHEKYPSLAAITPQSLDPSRVKLFSWITDNVSTMTAVGFLVSAAALPFFGFEMMAAGIAGPLLFQVLDSANYIPAPISLFAERHLPQLSTATTLIGGGLFSQLFAGGYLVSTIPGLSSWVQKEIEPSLRYRLDMKGPTLNEIDAPWKELNDLSFDEICYILKHDDEALYEVNPAHCSKQVAFSQMIPEERNFKKLLAYFAETNWKEREKIIEKAFKGDEQLKDEVIESAAEKLQERIEKLVAVLCNEAPVTGFREDLEDAQTNCSLILGYLQRLEDPIEREDILMKLSIEGGDYCARGIKRASQEITEGFSPLDPAKRYEEAIQKGLQVLRKKILQSYYEKVIELIATQKITSMKEQTTDAKAVALAEDVHLMDTYRQSLSLGFYPVTDNERRRFGINDFSQWLTFSPARQHLYSEYQFSLNEVIQEEGQLNFINHMRQKINDLEQLTAAQKEELIDTLSTCPDGETTLENFRRLFFVMLGVLNVNLLELDWEELPSDVEDLSDFLIVNS